MSKVWRRLQRVGKKAVKYHFASYSHSLRISCNSKWQPDKVFLVWSRRGRKNTSQRAQWEPSLTDSYEGTVVWEKWNDAIEFDLTLYKDINATEATHFEEKEWTLTVMSEDSKGKKRLLASGKLLLDQFAGIEPVYKKDIVDMPLRVECDKIKAVSIRYSIACTFIKEGKATDEDMLSVDSYASSAACQTNNPYLNSNIMFDKNRQRADDADDHHHNDAADSNAEASSLISSSLHFDFTQDDMDIGTNRDLLVTPPLPSIVIADYNNIQSAFRESHDYGDMVNLEEIIDADMKASQQEKRCAEQVEGGNDRTGAEEPNESTLVASSTLTQSTTVEAPPNVNESTININNNNNNIITATDANKEGEEETKCGETDISNSLLEWCNSVIAKSAASEQSGGRFSGLVVRDFGGESWSNGLAFCAIIFNFRPDLIDLSVLDTKDAKRVLKEAFKASDAEQILRVVDVHDMHGTQQVDQLSAMTYLHQMRNHFESAAASSSSSSSTIKRQSSQVLLKQASDAVAAAKTGTSDATQNDVCAKVATLPVSLSVSSRLSTFTTSSNPFNFDQIKAKMTANKANSTSQVTNATNRKVLTMQQSSSFEGVESSATPSPLSSSPTTRSLVAAVDSKRRAKQMAAAETETADMATAASPKKRAPPPASENIGPISTNKALPAECQPDATMTAKTVADELIGVEYINQEIANLRNRQLELDKQGAWLEQQLRSVLRTNSSSANNAKSATKQAAAGDQQQKAIVKSKNNNAKRKQLEDHLLRRWFLLVNEKNALVHQQQELEILQNEKSLEKRYEMLSNQLRYLMSLDDRVKSNEQRVNESLLFNELINLVNKRNELVIQMDEENRMIGQEQEIDEFVKSQHSFQQAAESNITTKQCSIQ